MIGGLALAVTRSRWGRYLMLGLAALAGVSAWGEIKERNGRREERRRRDVRTLKTIRRMQDAGARIATDRRSVARRMRDGSF